MIRDKRIALVFRAASFLFDRLGIAAIAYIGALVIFFLIIAHGFYLVDTKLRKPHD